MKLPKLSKNWKVVGLSLLGATTFWFFNALSKDYDAHVQYPLEFEFQQDSLVVVDPLPEYIQLEVAGGGWDLLRRTTWIGAKPIVIRLDNPTEVKLYPKNNLRRIVSEQLKDITVKYILTDSVFINIEPKVDRKVIVKVDSAAVALATNYRITSPINLSNDTIEVSGPVSLIKQLKSPYIISLREQNIRRNFDDDLTIPLFNNKIMSSKPEEINVSFRVEEFEKIEMTVPLEKVNFDNVPDVLLRDTTATVSFLVAESLADQIKASDFNIIADLSLLNSVDSTISLITVFAPEEIVDYAIKNEKVKVEYVSQ